MRVGGKMHHSELLGFWLLLLLVKDSSHTHAAASLLLALRCKNFYVHKYLLW